MSFRLRRKTSDQRRGDESADHERRDHRERSEKEQVRDEPVKRERAFALDERPEGHGAIPSAQPDQNCGSEQKRTLAQDEPADVHGIAAGALDVRKTRDPRTRHATVVPT